ncbi:hypothetical protein MARLIPOL_04090 [Marinobacter lipolyticus SM19]|uniref:Porin n=1 Tax=Marinobacter lipolyticus SM19 TaxID=1318628 RepID=R8B3U0_9GAMM|nr:hypothetical protein [Marinobacter lipolyticus]EON93184.1 hypothetical protein MARLIPOL_04090 [Marinobacter lipolyticus SM19]
MTKTKKLLLAFAMASASSHSLAVDLGELNGAKFNIGGYIKAEGIFSNPDEDDSKFLGSIRQSRLNFKASKDIGDHKVSGFFEGDFYGSNASGTTYDWRVRHAFLQVDDLTIGQTWSGQFLAVVPYDAPHLDFFNAGRGNAGGNGGVVRPDLVVRYNMGDFKFTMQDPINAEAGYPDFVINYAKKFEKGSAISVAVTGRDVAKSNVTNDSSDSEFGGAVLLAGKYSIGNTTLHLNGYTGEGQGVYSGFGFGGAWHPALRPAVDANADGELIKTTGLVGGISHKFMDNLRGAVRYSQIKADETTPGTEDTLELTHVNLVYTYLPGLDFGVEWRDQNVATHSTRPAGQQVELMAKYSF